MKTIKKFLTSALLFTIPFISFSQEGTVFVNHDNLSYMPPSDSGNDCAGGEIHDDGTFEGGVGWASVTTDGRFVIKFIPTIYPWKYTKFCIALGRAPSVDPNMTFDIVVYDTTGAGGTPGNQVYERDTVHVTNLPIIPVYQFYFFQNLDIPPLYNGAYFIGIKYNPSNSNYLKYSATDANGPYWPGYYWSNFQPYWTPIEQGFLGFYKCLGYRMEGYSLVGISGNTNGIPTEYSLSQNYPNPFNPSTTITYSIPKSGDVTLKVFDILGREVLNLVNEYKERGYYSVEFTADNFSSGVYIYKLVSGDFTAQRKMVLMK